MSQHATTEGSYDTYMRQLATKFTEYWSVIMVVSKEWIPMRPFTRGVSCTKWLYDIHGQFTTVLSLPQATAWILASTLQRQMPWCNNTRASVTARLTSLISTTQHHEIIHLSQWKFLNKLKCGINKRNYRDPSIKFQGNHSGISIFNMHINIVRTLVLSRKNGCD